MLFKAASLISAGAGISRLAMLGAVVVAARSLSLEEFGIWGFIQSTIILMASVGSLGIGNVITIDIAATEDKAARAELKAASFLSGSVLGLSGSSILVALSLPLASLGLNSPENWWIFLIASPLIFLTITTNCQNSIFLGEGKFTTASGINATGGLLTAVCIVAGAKFGGLSSALVGQAFGLSCQLVIGQLLLPKLMGDSWIDIPFSKIRELISKGSPLAVSGLFAFGATWVCFALAAHRINGLAEIALVNAALQWRNIIGFLPNQAIASSIPIISKAYSRGEHQEVKSICIRTIIYSYITAILFVVPLTLFPQHALSLFGEKYQSQPQMIYWCCVLILIEILNRCIGTFFNIFGLASKNIPMTMIFAFVAIGTSFATASLAPLTIILSLLIGMTVSCIWALPRLSRTLRENQNQNQNQNQ